MNACIEGDVSGSVHAVDVDVARAEHRCIDSTRLGGAYRERTLTGWLRHSCAARARRSAQAGRIWRGAVSDGGGGGEGHAPFELIRKVARPGMAVEAAHKQDTRHGDSQVRVVAGKVFAHTVGTADVDCSTPP